MPPGCPELFHSGLFILPCLPRCGAASPAHYCTQQWLVLTTKRGLRMSVKLKIGMQSGDLIISPHVQKQKMVSTHMQEWNVIRTEEHACIVHRVLTGETADKMVRGSYTLGYCFKIQIIALHIKLWPYKPTFTPSTVRWVCTFLKIMCIIKNWQVYAIQTCSVTDAVNDELLTICTRSFWSIKLEHNENLDWRRFQLHLAPKWLHVEYWLCKAF